MYQSPFLGNKKMLVWRPELLDSAAALEAEVRTEPVSESEELYLSRVDPEAWMDQADCLVGSAGDILYWPSGFWHVGASAEFSVSANMAIYMRAHRDGAPQTDSQHAWSADEVAALNAMSLPLEGNVVPIQVPSEILPRVRDHSQDAPAFVAWMRHAGGLGFAMVPPPRDRENINDATIVTLGGALPVLWSPISGTTIVVAAGGYVFQCPSSVQQLLVDLDRSVPATVGSLLAAAGNDKAASRSLIESLLAVYALDVVAAE
jgi:hypothetical protein